MARTQFGEEPENEADNSVKHPEFVAKDRRTGIELDVEAKQRNRWPKLKQEDFDAGTSTLKMNDLLSNAFKKYRNRPYVIFLDIGLPVAELRDAARQAITDGQPDPVELRARDRFGRQVLAVNTLTPLRGPEGDIRGAILAMTTTPLEESD